MIGEEKGATARKKLQLIHSLKHHCKHMTHDRSVFATADKIWYVLAAVFTLRAHRRKQSVTSILVLIFFAFYSNVTAFRKSSLR
jgi:hypothetical protein